MPIPAVFWLRWKKINRGEEALVIFWGTGCWAAVWTIENNSEPKTYVSL